MLASPNSRRLTETLQEKIVAGVFQLRQEFRRSGSCQIKFWSRIRPTHITVHIIALRIDYLWNPYLRNFHGACQTRAALGKGPELAESVEMWGRSSPTYRNIILRLLECGLFRPLIERFPRHVDKDMWTNQLLLLPHDCTLGLGVCK